MGAAGDEDLEFEFLVRPPPPARARPDPASLAIPSLACAVVSVWAGGAGELQQLVLHRAAQRCAGQGRPGSPAGPPAAALQPVSTGGLWGLSL